MMCVIGWEVGTLRFLRSYIA